MWYRLITANVLMFAHMFGKIVIGAMHCVLNNRESLYRVLLIPFLVLILIALIGNYGLFSDLYNYDFITLVLSVLSVLVHIVIAVNTHRVLLIGDSSVLNWGVGFWTEREYSYFSYTVLLSAPALILYGLSFINFNLSFINEYLVAIIVIIFIWLFCRLSIIFPSIAVDKQLSLTKSWRLTKNHQFLMFGIVIVLPIILMMPSYVLLKLPFGELIYSVFSSLVVVIEIAALSLAYKVIIELNEMVTE